MSASSNEIPEMQMLHGEEDVDPNTLVGEAVEPEHGLDVDSFTEESDE